MLELRPDAFWHRERRSSAVDSAAPEFDSMTARFGAGTVRSSFAWFRYLSSPDMSRTRTVKWRKQTMKYWKLTGEAELRVSIQALRKYTRIQTCRMLRQGDI